MELPLVVGVDGSDGSLTALDWAVDEAARRGLPLRIVHASLWERYEGTVPSFGSERPADEIMTERVMASAEQRVRKRAPAVQAHPVAVPEDAAAALLRESHEAALVVTGSSGRGALKGLLLGSVSLAVAGRAHCPVVVVRGEAKNVRGECHKVVVGVGDPAESAAALRFALREARARTCEVEAVRAWRCAEQRPADRTRTAGDTAYAHEERAARFLAGALAEPQGEYPDVPVRRTAVEGPAHKVLVGLSADADLLVVGSGRRQGHLGLQLGRVSHTALHHSACPVAVVPHA
ncbi:universal stress protein [Streptomyces sp. UNOC14_S4]|uniref:universal stress protein n=1 Tax=Streptomyces sp. UNOC14_S4 TaxID=2872340 RepID=UPI001E64980F|nr:universal stress protein [Streptomyces sp. UNOC14_S4]MCC3768250.1 universal stress protein [Streptomyces sp. UNOC14_S4]